MNRTIRLRLIVIVATVLCICFFFNRIIYSIEPRSDISTDGLSLLLYSDSLNGRYCKTIHTALIFGLNDVRIIGKSIDYINVSVPDKKFEKIYSLHNELKSFEENKVIVFSDAYDVLFQGNFDSHKDKNSIMFNAEVNCWPFTHPHPSIYNCPQMQGDSYLKNRTEVPLACKMSKDKAEALGILNFERSAIYLNSGLSIGTARMYKKLLDATISLVNTLPALCKDDQGVFTWLYLQGYYGVTLDYERKLFVSANEKLFNFNFTTEKGLWSFNESLNYPTAIHFNGDKMYFDKFYSTLLFEKMDETVGNKFIYAHGKQVLFKDICPLVDYR